jgi:Spy/CpxP family protein refolding chaperone
MSLSVRQMRDSIIIILLGALLVFAWLIFKQLSLSSERGFPPQPPEHFEKMMEEQLNMTASQRKQLEEHRSAHMGEARQLFERLSQAQEALMEEFNKPTLDSVAIASLQKKVKSVLVEMEDHKLKGMYELRNILTLEQFKKLHQKMGELHWRQGGLPPPPPLPPDED